MNASSPALESAKRNACRYVALLWLIAAGALFWPAGEPQSEFFSRAHPAGPRPQPLTCRIPNEPVALRIKALSNDIARRFHVAEATAMSITHAAFSAAGNRGIDPTLVLAVAAVESRFKSEAVNRVTGAKGLMQVVAQWHPVEVRGAGGEPSMLLIAPNIDVGAAILAQYLHAADGNVEHALDHYLGKAGAQHYLQGVRRERAHLSSILTAT
ncbi:MAG: hypothetical protein NVSMB10_10600 [Steroidobacteraceae bacterium]